MSHDYLITGAGPSGPQLAALPERDCAVLERGSGAGTFLTRYSRGYFPAADGIVRYFRDFAAGLNVHYDVEVTRISRDGNGFVAQDHGGRTWHAGNLVMAVSVRECLAAA